MASSKEIFEDESLLEICLYTSGLAESAFLPHLDIRSIINLTRTNRAIHGLFAIDTYKETLLNALMNYFAHVIVNEPTNENIKNLKIILSVYPEFLLRKINKVVFEKTGQAYIDYSLLQLAYAEGDDELCLIFAPHFKRACGSVDAARDEIRRQLDEKFPEESEAKKQQRKSKEKSQLVALLTSAKQAFTNEQFNNNVLHADGKLILSPATHTAITSFKESFGDLQPKKIETGRRFSLNRLPIIFTFFIPAAGQWHYDERCNLFEEGVLSFALAFKPIIDAMRGCQGLLFLQENGEPFERRITLRNSNINFHDCLRGASLYFSGLAGAYVDIVNGGRVLGSLGRFHYDYQNLCRAKEANLQSLRSQPENILRPSQ